MTSGDNGPTIAFGRPGAGAGLPVSVLPNGFSRDAIERDSAGLGSIGGSAAREA